MSTQTQTQSKPFPGYPAYVDDAVELLGGDLADPDVARRAARAETTVHRVADLVHQALDRPAPHPDTLRRLRELLDGARVAAVSIELMLDLLTPPPGAGEPGPGQED